MAVPHDTTETDAPPWVRVSQDARKLRITAGGAWIARHAALLDPQLREIGAGGAADVEIDGSGIASLDSTGCWLLVRTKIGFEAAGQRVPLFAVPKLYAALLAKIEAEHVVPPVEILERNTLTSFLERIG
ncbi:MAG TPA: STAS domain-containing protein, partial [Rhizomicrobium sp.]